eukprot:3702792-Prymnesium_polylepis.1
MQRRPLHLNRYHAPRHHRPRVCHVCELSPHSELRSSTVVAVCRPHLEAGLLILLSLPLHAHLRADLHEFAPGQVQYSQQYTAEEAPQVEALQSIRENAVLPAAKLGWLVEVIASVDAQDAGAAARFAHLVSTMLCATAVRFEPLAPRQSGSILSALIWAWYAGIAKFGQFGALLLLRADTIIKMPLQLPPPPSVRQRPRKPHHLILVPFECRVTNNKSALGPAWGIRVADTRRSARRRCRKSPAATTRRAKAARRRACPRAARALHRRALARPACAVLARPFLEELLLSTIGPKLR